MNTQWRRCVGRSVHGGVWSFRALSRCTTLPHLCLPTWKLSKRRTVSGLGKASSRRQNQLLTPFPAHLPSLENGGWG